MSFYMTYSARWPDYFHVAEGPVNKIMGYSKPFLPTIITIFYFKKKSCELHLNWLLQ
jgi:hypothetical protein